MAFAYGGIKIDLDDSTLERQVNNMRSGWKKAMDGMSAEAKAFDDRWQEATAGIKDTKRIVSGILVSQAFYTLSNVMIDASAAALQFSKDMETAAISMEYFVKGADKAQKSAAYLREINLFAAQTPFSTQEALSLSKYMQAMGVGMENTKSFLKVITDTAAATGATEQNLQRITFGLGQMMTKGRLANEEIRQLANANIPIYEILQEQLGLTGDQISKIGNYWVDADKAVVAILRGLEKRYAGASDKVAETVTGMTDTLKDNSLIIIQQAGSGAYDMFADKLRVLRDLLNDYRDISTNLGSAGLFTQMLTDLEDAGASGEYILTLIGNIRNLADSLSEAAYAATPFFQLLGTTAYTEISVLSYSLTALARSLTLTIEMFDTVTDKLGFVGDGVEKFGKALASVFIAYKAAQAVSFLGQGIMKIGYSFTDLMGIMARTIPFFGAMTVAQRTLTASLLVGASAAASAFGIYAMINNALSGFDSPSTGALPDDYMSAYDKYAAEMEAYNKQIEQYQNAYNEPFSDIAAASEDGVGAFDAVAAASSKAAASVKSDWVAAFDEVYSIPDNSGSSGKTIEPPDFGASLIPPMFTFPTRDSLDALKPEFPWSSVFDGSPLGEEVADGIDSSFLYGMLLPLIGILNPLLWAKVFTKNGSNKADTTGTAGTIKAGKTPEELQAATVTKIDELAKTIRSIRERLKVATGEIVDPLVKELKNAQTALNSAVSKYAVDYNGIKDIKELLNDVIELSDPEIRQRQLVGKVEEIIHTLKANNITSTSIASLVADVEAVAKSIQTDITNGLTSEATMSPETLEAYKRVGLLSDIQHKLEAVAKNTKKMELYSKTMAIDTLNRATNTSFNSLSLSEDIKALSAANGKLTEKIGNLTSALRIPLNADAYAEEAAASERLQRNKEFITEFQGRMVAKLDQLIRPISILENYNKDLLFKYSQANNYLGEQVASMLEITQYTKEMPEITKAIKAIHLTVARSYSQQQKLDPATVEGLKKSLIEAFREHAYTTGISKAVMDNAVTTVVAQFERFDKTDKVLEQIKQNLALVTKAVNSKKATKMPDDMSTYRGFIAQAEKLFKDSSIPAARLESRLTKLYDVVKAGMLENKADKQILSMLDNVYMEFKDKSFDLQLLKDLDKVDDKLHGILMTSGRHLTTFEKALEDQKGRLVQEYGPKVLEEPVVIETLTRIADEATAIREMNKFLYSGMTMDKMPEKLKGDVSLPMIERFYKEFVANNRIKATTDGKILNAYVSSSPLLLDKLPQIIRENVIFANNMTNGKLATVLSSSEIAGVMHGRSGYNITLPEVYINNLSADSISLRAAPKSIEQLISMSYGAALQQGIIYATDQIMRIAGTGLTLAPGRLMYSEDGKIQAEIDAFVKRNKVPITVLDAKVLSGLEQLMAVVEKESFGPELAGIYELTEKGFKDLLLMYDDAFYQFVGQSIVAGVDTVYASFLDVGSLNVKKPDATSGKYTRYDLASSDELERLTRLIENDVLASIDRVPNLLENIKQNVRIIKMNVPKDLKEAVLRGATAFQTMLTYAPELARLGKLEEFLQIITTDGIKLGAVGIRELTATIPTPSTGNAALNTAIRSITSDLSSTYSKVQENAMTRLEGLLSTLQSSVTKEVRNLYETTDTYGKLISERVLELRNYKPTSGSDVNLSVVATTDQLNTAIQHIKDVKDIYENRSLTLIRQLDDVKKKIDFLASQNASLEDPAVKATAEYAQKIFYKVIEQLGIESNAGAVINSWRENNAITEPLNTTIGTANYEVYSTYLASILKTSGAAAADIAAILGVAGKSEDDIKKLGLSVQDINARANTEWAGMKFNPEGTTGKYAAMYSVPEDFLKGFGTKSKYIMFLDEMSMQAMYDAADFATKMEEALKNMEAAGQRFSYETVTDRNGNVKVDSAGNVKTSTVETPAYKAAQEAAFKAAQEANKAAGAAMASSGTVFNLFGKTIKIPDNVAKNVGTVAGVALLIPSILSDIQENKDFRSMLSGMGTADAIAAQERGTPVGNIAGMNIDTYLKTYFEMTEQEKLFWGSKVISGASDETLMYPDENWSKVISAINGVSTNIFDNMGSFTAGNTFTSVENMKAKSEMSDAEYKKYLEKQLETTLKQQLSLGEASTGLAQIADYLIKSGDTESEVAELFYDKYGSYMDSVVLPTMGYNADWVTAAKMLVASNADVASMLTSVGGAFVSAGDLSPQDRSYLVAMLDSIKESVQQAYLDNEINPKQEYNSTNTNPMVGDVSTFIDTNIANEIGSAAAQALRDTLGISFRDIKDEDGHSTRTSVMNIDASAIEDNIIGWTQALPKNLTLGNISVQDAEILASAGIQINSDGTVTFMKAMNENTTGSNRVIDITADDISKAVAGALSLKGLELDFSGAEARLNLDVTKLSGEMESALFMLNDSLTGEMSDSMASAISGLGEVLDSGYFEITNKAVLNGSMTITEYINSLGATADKLSPEVRNALEAIDQVIAQEGTATAEAVTKWADGIKIESPLKEEELTDELRAQFASIGVTFVEEEEKLYAIINRPGNQLVNGIAIIPEETWNQVNENVRKGLEQMGLTITENAGLAMLDFNGIMEKGLTDVVELYVNNPELWDQLPATVVQALAETGFSAEEGMLKIKTSMMNRLTEIGSVWFQSWSTLDDTVVKELGATELVTKDGLMRIQQVVDGTDTTGGVVKDFEELPAQLQEFLRESGAAVEGSKYVIKNSTEAAFLTFTEAVSAAMADASATANSGANEVANAVARAMLEVQRMSNIKVGSTGGFLGFGDTKNTIGAAKTINGITYYPEYDSKGNLVKAWYYSNDTGAQKSITADAAARYGFRVKANAYGSLVTGDQLVRMGEFGKSEAIIPLEQPSVMAKLGRSITAYMPSMSGAVSLDDNTLRSLYTMYNAGIKVATQQTTQQQVQGVDTAAVVKSVLDYILPAIESSQTDDKQPLYVGTLVADDKGLKELYRKFEVIKASETVRRG